VERLRHRFHSAYLRHYLAAGELDTEHLADWTAVVAGARLAEDISGEQLALLALVRASLDN